MELSIATHRLADGVVEISPRGEIDFENAHLLRAAIDTALTEDVVPSLIRVDLWSVTFIDSVAISALVSGYHLAAVRGTGFVVVNPTEFVYRQLYISGLVGLFGAPVPRPAAPERDAPRPVG